MPIYIAPIVGKPGSALAQLFGAPEVMTMFWANLVHPSIDVGNLLAELKRESISKAFNITSEGLSTVPPNKRRRYKTISYVNATDGAPFMNLYLVKPNAEIAYYPLYLATVAAATGGYHLPPEMWLPEGWSWRCSKTAAGTTGSFEFYFLFEEI